MRVERILIPEPSDSIMSEESTDDSEKVDWSFQSKIDLAIKNCTQFSNFTEYFPDQLKSHLKLFLKSYAFENQSMPNRRIYVFRWAVWIRRYAYRFSESNKIWDNIRKGSSSEFREIDAIGYIDFKAMNQLLKWDD